MDYSDPLKRLLSLIAILAMGALVLLSVARKEIAYALRFTAPEKQVGSISAGLQKPEPRIILAEPYPELTAHSYIVRLIGASKPFLYQREWKAYAPASLTKLLTVVIAREELPQEAPILFSEAAKNVEPKLSPVEAGESLIRDDAIRLALMESYNDAAGALALTVEKEKNGYFSDPLFFSFSELMNRKAEMLGLDDSAFINPSGLDEEGHYASAEDLARLAEYIWLNHRDLWEIMRTINAVVYTDQGRAIQVKNTNELLEEFPALLGGKTGLTNNAKGALLFLYPVRPNNIAITVILGSEDRFEDARKIIHWLESVTVEE